MRIAQVVSSYFPLVGGVETHVRRLARGCAASGEEVTVLTHRTGDEPAEERVDSVRVLRFPLAVRSATYPYSSRLAQYLRDHAGDFDLVHAHSYHTLVGHAAVRSRLPFVFTPHYHGTGHTPLSALLHHVYRPVGGRQFTAADAVVCVSEAERALVVRDFPDAAGKVTTIPNGTDPRPAVIPRTGSAKTRMVLTVGRLERYKNLDLVIRAFRSLPSPAELVIAGDGPDRSRLEKIARPADPQLPIRFTGRIPDPELDELLAQADVVTSASDHEAFGLIMADGLASGARVVSSDIPAHREVGRLAGPGAPVTFADPRDTRRFAAALAAALREGRHPGGTIQLPSWADVAGQTRELYARARADGRHASRREYA
jgi:glycosyltransferase involved in cell wall biosynthesis